MKKVTDIIIKTVAILATILIITCGVKLTANAMSVDADTAHLHSDTQINLNWTSVANAVYYNVSRNSVRIAQLNIATDRNYLSFEDTDLIPQTTYDYKVIAVGPNGNVLDTDSRSATTTKMLRPSIVNSHIDLNNNIVTLTWLNNSLAVKSTVIRRVEGEEIVTVDNDGTSVSFMDNSLISGTSTYVLKSRDNKGRSSDFSDEFTIKPITVPKIEAVMGTKSTTISWNATHDIIHYRLERAKYQENSWGNWETVASKIKVDTTKLTDNLSGAGTYRYRLCVDNEKYRGISNISKPLTRLSKPSNLKCVPVSVGRIDLSWTNPPLGDYLLRVERKMEKGSFEELAVLDRNITSFSDSDNIVLDKSYYYRIVAFDTNDSTSPSDTVYINTSQPTVISSINLNITTPSKITITWEDTSVNESGFIIERKRNSEDFVEIARVPANTTFYEDGTVNTENKFTYRLIPFNPFGKAKSYSTEVSCYTSNIKDPPISLTLEAVSDSQIDLSWTYENYASYKTVIERKTDIDGKWKTLAISEAGFTAYSDRNLRADTQYFYRVKSFLDDNVFSRPYPKAEDSVSAYTKLRAPQHLKAVLVSQGLVKLSWLDSFSDDCELIIERKTGDGQFRVLKTLDLGTLNWYNSDINSDVNYTYRVKVENSTNSSIYSNEASVEEENADAPHNLKFVFISNLGIKLSWEDRSDSEKGFKVERKEGQNGKWTEIATLDTDTTSYTVKNLEENKPYFFRVKTYDRFGVSDSCSEEVKVLIKALPPPSNLVVTALSNTKVELQWKGNTVDEEGYAGEDNIIEGYIFEGYIIERKTLNEDFTEDFTEIHRTVKDITEYIDDNVTVGNAYYYRVKAYSNYGYTDYTNIGIIDTTSSTYFNDLQNVSWAREAVESLAGKDIIKGKASGIFAPDDKITRAEFISIIIKSFNLERTPVGTFSDVLPGNWFYKSVMIAENIGIVSGMGDNSFYPNEPIKREDMAVIIVKTLKIIDKPLPYYNDSVLEGFSDREMISPYALQSLAVLNGEKIINGKGDSKLAPKDFATRAEAAVILYKVLEKL